MISAPDSRDGNTEVDESKLPEVQKWWNASVGNDQEGYERRVLDSFAGD